MLWHKGRCLAYSLANLTNLFIIFPNFFHNTLNTTWIITSFNYKYLLMCVSTFYIVFMAMSAQEPMMQFATPLLPLHEMLVFTWDKNNYMCFLQPCSTLLINESTLCSPKMAFALQLMLSLSTQHEHIYFLDLAQLKDLLLPMWLKLNKRAITIDT